MTNTPLAVVLANFKSKWNPGWTHTQSHRVGTKDRFLLLNKTTGDIHLRNIIGSKRIDGTALWEINEGANTDKALLYNVGSLSFLMTGNSSTGRVSIYPMNAEAQLGDSTFESVWSSGWNNMETYTAGGKTFLVIYKTGTGDVHIHELTTSGLVGTRTTDTRLPASFEVARTYQVGINSFLFLLSSNNGLVEIHGLSDSGRINEVVEKHDWSSDWTVASFGKVGADTILFLLKTSTGQVHLHKMQADGGVGARTFTNNWSSGWSSVAFYNAGTTACFSLLKSSDGAGHLHEMNLDGTVGTRINPKEPFTKAQMEKQMTMEGAGEGLLYDYFLDISRGRVAIDPSFATDWVTIPDSWENVKRLDRHNKAKEGLNAALAQGYSISNSQSVIVLHSQPGDSGSDGGRLTLSHPDRMSLEFHAHEVLHTWNLQHSFSDDESKTDQWGNTLAWGVYDDPWDVMSALGAYGHATSDNSSVGPGLNIFNLEQMGWYDDAYTTHIQAGDAESENTINSLSIKDNNEQLNLKVHYALGEYYSMEYRTKDEWDQGIPKSTALIHNVVPYFTTRKTNWKGNFGQDWDIFNVFRADNRSFLLRYKTSSGEYQINRISEIGKLEERTVSGVMHSNWTSLESFVMGNETFLLMSSATNGKVKVMQLTSAGRLGTEVDDRAWSAGWTSTKVYKANDNTFLFLLKASTGEVHIHKMNANGSIGEEVKRYDWSSGWSQAHFYYKGKKAFLLLYKTSTGKLHTHKMNNDGSVGDRIDTETVAMGWETIHSYGTVGTKICWMNSLSKVVHFQDVDSNGSLMAIPDDAKRTWSEGWSHAFGFGTSSGCYMFIYKRTEGRCEIVVASVPRVMRKRSSEDPRRGPVQEVNENGVNIKVLPGRISRKKAGFLVSKMKKKVPAGTFR